MAGGKIGSRVWVGAFREKGKVEVTETYGIPSGIQHALDGPTTRLRYPACYTLRVCEQTFGLFLLLRREVFDGLLGLLAVRGGLVCVGCWRERSGE